MVEDRSAEELLTINCGILTLEMRWISEKNAHLLNKNMVASKALATIIEVMSTNILRASSSGVF